MDQTQFFKHRPIDYFCFYKKAIVNPLKIVITGAPGTGKTSVINELDNLGYRCLHEVVRNLTLKAKKEVGNKSHGSNPLAFVPDPLAFNRKILKLRKKQFLVASAAKDSLTFLDRGIPDILAYMNFFNQKYPIEFENASKDYRYDLIFLFPPWKEIYVADNERLESFKEAVSMHDHLLQIYTYYNYKPISVPKSTVEARSSYVLETVKSRQ